MTRSIRSDLRSSVIKYRLIRCRVMIFCAFLIALSTPAAAEPPFKVGIILPLSGPIAEYGVAAKNGFELARKEAPEKLKSLELLIEDNEYDGKKSLTALQKFGVGGGVAVLYVWGYGPNQAIVPVAESQHIPLFAVSAERAVSRGKKYTIRFCYTIDRIAAALITQIRASGLQHIGVLKTELAYMDGLMTELNAAKNAGETFTVVQNFQPGDSDFRATIARLKSKPEDGIGVFLLAGQVSQFFRQAKQMDLKTHFIGTDFFDSAKEIRDSGEAIEGAVFAAPYLDPEFVERYRKEFGNDLQAAWAANAYEFALLTAELFPKGDEHLAPEQVLARYSGAGGARGGATRYRFNGSKEAPGFDVTVSTRRVEKGNAVTVQ